MFPHSFEGAVDLDLMIYLTQIAEHVAFIKNLRFFWFLLQQSRREQSIAAMKDKCLPQY